MTQNLSAAQQTQLDNRDSSGQFKSKAHADVEDTAGVLGVDARPDSPPARDPLRIDPLAESAVELSTDEERTLSADPRQRYRYHEKIAEELEETAYYSGDGPDSDALVDELRFHRCAQWAYESDARASFAAPATTDTGQERLVQHDRHGHVLRELDGTPRTVGSYEAASMRRIPEGLKTDDGFFDLKKARAASDDHLAGAPADQTSLYDRAHGAVLTPQPRDEATRIAYAKAAHRASPAMRWAEESGRNAAADEAEAAEQATRSVPTTSLREPAYSTEVPVDHAKPGELRERIFDYQEAVAESDWQREG